MNFKGLLIGDLVKALNQDLCIGCSELFVETYCSAQDKWSKEFCGSSHFLCYKCRIKFYHKRSQRFCKCRRAYTTAEKESLENEIRQLCIVCIVPIARRNDIKYCADCEYYICKDCCNKLGKSSLCLTCAEQTCGDCGKTLGTKYVWNEEKRYFKHMGCF